MIKTSSCIGCQACVDVCPVNAISFEYDTWGEGRAKITTEKCIDCGLCDRICSSKNLLFNEVQKNVYAAVSKKNRAEGSSGGLFYELAKAFIEDGGVVYGAAFDKNLKLVHQKAETQTQINPLCKSKYIHSDAKGVYKEIGGLLESGKKVMFVGTPCQVSAIKNLYSRKYADLLFLVDFLCHWTGTQKIFDLCIKNLEKKKGGKITKFCFRSKAKRAEHSFTYNLYRRGKNKLISGYPFEFSYYFSYLKYRIFNDFCYECKYSTTARVGDITLGDFWGIEKYNSRLKDTEGVSMVSINSKRGLEVVGKIQQKCKWYCYPLEYATKKNQAFNSPVQLLDEKRKLKNLLDTAGEEQLIKALTCPDIIKSWIYVRMPQSLIVFYHKIRGLK